MKSRKAIEAWFHGHLKQSRLTAALVGVGMCVVGSVVLLVTYIIVFMGFLVLSCAAFSPSFQMAEMLSVVVITLLFIGNATTDWRYLNTMTVTTGTVHKKPVHIYIPGVGMGSTINPFAPDSMRSFIKLITGLLFFGPRMFTIGLRGFWRCWQLTKLDESGCALVLSLLAASDNPVSFADLANGIPEPHDPSKVLSQVQLIDGVRLITTEPQGLGLRSDLRDELGYPSRQKTKKNQAALTTDAPDKEKPIVSLVLLLRKPRHLDVDTLREIVNNTFNLDLTGGGEESTEFVVGKGEIIMAQFQGYLFNILSASRPYFDDVETAAKSIQEIRLRKAVMAHKAWLSVDLLKQYDNPLVDDPYWYIAKLIVALAPADALAVLYPANQQVWVWDANVAKALQTDKPLEALAKHQGEIPVLEISNDDPRMQAAFAEARRRWPEFASAYEYRRSDQKFFVKYPIREGEYVESIWLMVNRLDGDVIHGEVNNEPVNIKKVQLGTRLKVGRDRIQDWLFSNGEKTIGGFSAKVLEAAMKRE